MTHRSCGQVMLGGHSTSDPPLPIPNRTVKRSRADDSAHLVCESRSPPGSLPNSPLAITATRAVYFVDTYRVGSFCRSPQSVCFVDSEERCLKEITRLPPWAAVASGVSRRFSRTWRASFPLSPATAAVLRAIRPIARFAKATAVMRRLFKFSLDPERDRLRDPARDIFHHS